MFAHLLKRFGNMSFKASETLLGIETCCTHAIAPDLVGFKASETLLGIETLPRLFYPLVMCQLQSL